MSKVAITHPTLGEKTVTRATLGTWRKQGWSLTETPKEDLNVLRESDKDQESPIVEETE